MKLYTVVSKKKLKWWLRGEDYMKFCHLLNSKIRQRKPAIGCDSRHHNSKLSKLKDWLVHHIIFEKAKHIVKLKKNIVLKLTVFRVCGLFSNE